MIISRTPFRISFFGGGTDYPSWYRLHGGAVLAATIDKYCYLTCRYLPPFFEHRYRIVYSKIEMASRIEDIGHPSVRETLLHLGVTRGIELHHDGDLPARSGMGSSSAFTVGLLHVLHSLHGRMVSRHQLAMEAIHIEQELLRETVGSQDQVMAAYGGLSHVRFLPSGEIVVRPVIASRERIGELNAHLMLFYTGIKRTASDVASSYVADIAAQRRQLRILSDLVEEGLSVLCGDDDINLFGELLHEAWQVKRNLSSLVSNRYVDEMYDEARLAGASGGKLLGAGGGGFLLLFAPPESQAAVTERLSRFIRVPFKFEFNGSQIALYDPETDYSHEDLICSERSIASFRELAEHPAYV
jgi:D-glycero-alpha-D-manno-heptose-7-phosphate kinase